MQGDAMGLLMKLIENVAEHCTKLDEVSAQDLERGDWRTLYAVLHALQIHAQSTIDALLHVCSLLALEISTPMTCIEKLKLIGLLNSEEASMLKRLVRFRNIVVHEYGRLDVERVKHVIESRGYREPLKILEKLMKELRNRGVEDP